MKIKVTLGTMQNASKLVSIAESISCDVDLCYGRYIVDAKSMLGVLSLPDFAYGELQIPVETEEEKRWRNNVKEAVKWNSACGNSYK